MRLHRYDYTVTLWTTDGASSPDDLIATILRDGQDKLPLDHYHHVEETLHDRATCPIGSTDVPERPKYPGDQRDKGALAAYWEARDRWIDAVHQEMMLRRSGGRS